MSASSSLNPTTNFNPAAFNNPLTNAIKIIVISTLIPNTNAFSINEFGGNIWGATKNVGAAILTGTGTALQKTGQIIGNSIVAIATPIAQATGISQVIEKIENIATEVLLVGCNSVITVGAAASSAIIGRILHPACEAATNNYAKHCQIPELFDKITNPDMVAESKIAYQKICTVTGLQMAAACGAEVAAYITSGAILVKNFYPGLFPGDGTAKAIGTFGITHYLLNPACAESYVEFKARNCCADVFENDFVCNAIFAKVVATCGAMTAGYIKAGQLLLT